MSNPQIDDTDSRIISLLEEDGRRSNRDIARILGITEKQVGARIRRLLQQDVMRIVAVVDVFAAGFEFMMTAGVRVDNRPATEVAQQLGMDRFDEAVYQGWAPETELTELVEQVL